jgi:hypothetical protein
MKKVANVKKVEPYQAALDQFKLLQTKIKRTRSLKTFLKTLTDLLNFIQKCPLFNNLLCKWERDKQQGLKQIHSLELSVYNKSKIAYDTLKFRLHQHQLIDHPEIQNHIQELDVLFFNSEPTCSPAPWRLAFDGVKMLGLALEELERTDLIQDLSFLKKRPISQWKSDICDYITVNKTYIHHFTFADGILELSDLHEKFYYKIENTPWAIWEQLHAIAWCYQTPFSYWQNKSLRYSSRFYRKESWQRLNLHGMWGEMNQIKQNIKPEREFLFQRKTLETYLDRLSIEILAYLKTYQLIEKFHLFLDGECLWVVLEVIIPHLSFQFFKVKEFNELKKIFGFVSLLAKSNSLTSLDIPDGYTVTSLLHHLNMPAKSQLAQLFFNGWSINQIHFKGKVISAKTAEQEVYIPDLLAELNSLHKRCQLRGFAPPLETFSKQRSD